MSAVLNTNVASLWASKNLLGAQSKLAGSVERLSSGLRINRARDDAAGLGVANSLTAQINGANQGVRNLNDAISMVQTAEGAIAAASEMGQRILMLATQGANGTLGATERAAIKTEMLQLISSINSISTRTKFSGNDLLNATSAQSGNTLYSMQISNDSNDQVSLKGEAFRNIGSGSYTTAYTALTAPTGTGSTQSLKVYVRVGVNEYQSRTLVTTGASGSESYKLDGEAWTAGGGPALFSRGNPSFTAAGDGHASTLSGLIDSAGSASSFTEVQAAAGTYVENLGKQRSLLGAYQNQMEYTLSNITELSSNLSSARSRVIDTDYASETASLTKGQILQQAATAMLAQANQMPNVILTLLK